MYTIISLFGVLFICGLMLAYLPAKSKINHIGISPEAAAHLRNNFKEPHSQFTTTDGKTLFIRIWNPKNTIAEKKDRAVLIFHGLTAHSGAYNLVGETLSAGGYKTFGLDYRGHGLSDGNRADSPGKERWTADLAEAVTYIKGLGYSKVIVLGHSLGVIASICATHAVPNEISGLVLLSAAYESRKGATKQPTFFQKIHILASSIFRPSYPVIEYSRDGLIVAKDSLYNYRYTLRFVRMLDVKKLRLPESLNIPVLVGVGDHDELFSVDQVKAFYNLVPGDKKEFFVMKEATHAQIPLENWEEIVTWLDRLPS